jgi:hypothetical protein
VRRFVVLVACCVAGSQFADLYWVIRRFRVGLWGPLDPLVHIKDGYTPAVPTALLLFGGLVLCAAYAWWIVTLCRQGPDDPSARPRPTEQPPGDPAVGSSVPATVGQLDLEGLAPPAPH